MAEDEKRTFRITSSRRSPEQLPPLKRADQFQQFRLTAQHDYSVLIELSQRIAHPSSPPGGLMLHLPQMARVERRLGAREGEPHQYVE